jgi:CRP-like cAMP-binding protein
VAIVLELPNGQTLRLKSMGAGTVVGEIAFYLGVPRSASVVALEKTTAWRLSSTRLRDMQREAPTLATLFHQYMARMLATKVVDTNRLVGALNQ